MHHQVRPTWLRSPLPSLEGNRGFTLIEMMIALVLFGVGLMALAQALPNGLSVRDKARRMTVATSLAQESVEQLRNLPFDAGQLSAGAHSDPDNPINGAYVRRWTVENNMPVQNMKRVTVRVSFPTSSADSVAVMTTQITRGTR